MLLENLFSEFKMHCTCSINVRIVREIVETQFLLSVLVGIGVYTGHEGKIRVFSKH